MRDGPACKLRGPATSPASGRSECHRRKHARTGQGDALPELRREELDKQAHSCGKQGVLRLHHAALLRPALLHQRAGVLHTVGWAGGRGQ